MALGKDFGVYSLNNGDLWQPFNYPAFGVTAGHFVSVTEGWVALGDFDNVQVWYTDNGGFDWELRDPQVFPLVSGIEMINDAVGFLASRDFVYKTIDGGFSWHPLNSIAASHIQDLHVTDENNLWAALDNGSVYFSNTGGSVWQEINPNLINSNRTLGIWGDASGRVWTVGKYFSILHSPDFGVTWIDQLPAAKQTLFEPNFFNAFVGMVGGSDGAILRTKNSGATWEAILFPRDEHFFGTVMLSDSVAVVGSSSGKVMKTSDQGETWTVIGENLGSITDLYAFDRQKMLLTNEDGDIYKTINGGSSWNKMYDGVLMLNALEFSDETNGWAAGIYGRILLTTNGGDSWTVQYNDGESTFSDIHFTSSTEGWVTSSMFGDSIWHTTDGGLNWSKNGLPIRTFWNAVSFMDQDTGWVVGGSVDNGVIYRTNNRGLSWFLDHTSPDPFMGIYSIPNSETAWAVGFGGNIMKYSSCASPPLLTELRGNLEPCAGDTLNYVVEFDDVDVFTWTFPSDWIVLGNTNTASIHFIAGSEIGQVTVQGSDACGDTTIQLFADVFPVTPPEVLIAEENGVLVYTGPIGVFQWLFNGEEIPGANESSYMPTISGSYQLHFTTFTSGCETTSNILEFTITAIDDISQDKLKVYPNPVDDFMIIRYSDGKLIPDGSKILMTNMEGRLVLNINYEGNPINLSDMPSGMYTIQVRTGTETLIRKMIIE
ncbi:MAG: YCF48-related protein [Saprospiraceae bacterium]